PDRAPSISQSATSSISQAVIWAELIVFESLLILREMLSLRPADMAIAIQVTSLHPTLGAEVRGVDLTRAVTPEVFAEIEAAFNRYRILVFPEHALHDEQPLPSHRLCGPPEDN